MLRTNSHKTYCRLRILPKRSCYCICSFVFLCWPNSTTCVSECERTVRAERIFSHVHGQILRIKTNCLYDIIIENTITSMYVHCMLLVSSGLQASNSRIQKHRAIHNSHMCICAQTHTERDAHKQYQLSIRNAVVSHETIFYICSLHNVLCGVVFGCR